MPPRFAFTGDGAYCGDGGLELQRLWQTTSWRSIKGCDGRFTCRDRALTRLSLWALCDTFQLDLACAVITVRRASEGMDGVEVVRLRGGGGLITYLKPEGTHIHTLNTESGLARKILALGAADSFCSALADGPRLMFCVVISVLSRIPEPQRTVAAPPLVAALRQAAARNATRPH